MLTCISRSKQGSCEDAPPPTDLTEQAVKSLSSQIKDMALKASGAYRHCAPFANQPVGGGGGSREEESAAEEKFRRLYRRTGSSNWRSATGRRELESRLKGISSGEGTPVSASGRRLEAVVFVEESVPKEWVAQVEPGVLITFVSLPRGGNDLKRIRFSRDMFNKFQAQRWWADNSEKVMELYNVQRLNPNAFPPRSEDGATTPKTESVQSSPVTPPLGREPLPRALAWPIGNSSSDSSDLQSTHSGSNSEPSCGAGSTPKLSTTSAAKTETSVSTEASSYRDLETEWVEEDQPGVYITIRSLPDGRRELKRVRFSREKFGELHARVWWEENRARIHKRYL